MDSKHVIYVPHCFVHLVPRVIPAYHLVLLALDFDLLLKFIGAFDDLFLCFLVQHCEPLANLTKYIFARGINVLNHSLEDPQRVHHIGLKVILETLLIQYLIDHF